MLFKQLQKVLSKLIYSMRLQIQYSFLKPLRVWKAGVGSNKKSFNKPFVKSAEWFVPEKNYEIWICEILTERGTNGTVL